MKFNTGSLPLGTREFSFVEDSEIVGLDDRFLGDVKVLARVEKTTRMVEVKASVSVRAKLVCDRCAEEYIKDLRTTFRIMYLFHEEDKAGYLEEEIVILPSEYTVVDITDDVRQYILLTVPLKLLCSEECKGLCSECGTNWNVGTCSCSESYVDPRWEQLNKLLNHN